MLRTIWKIRAAAFLWKAVAILAEECGSDPETVLESMLLVFCSIFLVLRVALAETTSDGATVAKRLATQSWKVAESG